MTSEIFDKAAATWDEKPRRVQLAKNIASAIEKAVPLHQQMKVLEIGCGTGLISIQLAQDVGSVLATDTSAGMLEVLEDKIKVLGMQNISTMNVDLTDDDSFLSGAFHLIVSGMTLHHITDTVTLLKRCRDLLAPDGVLAIADLDKEDGSFHGDMAGVKHHGFDSTELGRLVLQAGFRNVHFATVHVITKEEELGGQRHYPVFLMTASL